MLRRLLTRERPGDAVLGEEYGGTAVLEGRQWVIEFIGLIRRSVPAWRA